MKLDRFKAYLEYQECEMKGFWRSFYLYENTKTEQIASVPASDIIDQLAMYYVCKDLGIEMPPEYKNFQDTWERIPDR